MDVTFWKNKTVLITGHTGFKGGWLVLWLQSLGANVIGFALPPSTQPNLFTLANIADASHSVLGDIRDFNTVQQLLLDTQPEIIIHMAAQPLVRHSYAEPLETYATNVMGTVHLLEAARSVKSVRVILNVTTDKCYDNKEWVWGYRENEALGGYDPYSSSKACAELVTAAYRNSYFHINRYDQHRVAIASARAGNVIGGGDWSQDRLIPDIIRSCLEKQSSVVIRNPNAQRPWQHVLEPLHGYLLLVQKLYTQPAEFSEAWNFGPDYQDTKPVSWIVDYIIKLLNNGASWMLDEQPQLHEAACLKLDCSKARSKLNWQPRWNLERGLAETVYWYRAYQAEEDMRNISLAQIESYMNHTIGN